MSDKPIKAHITRWCIDDNRIVGTISDRWRLTTSPILGFSITDNCLITVETRNSRYTLGTYDPTVIEVRGF